VIGLVSLSSQVGISSHVDVSYAAMTQLPEPHLREQDAYLVGEVGICMGEVIQDASYCV
jgi:hypothetical protein